ncbi:transposase [Chloroflexi bacterium TSY]|nr:transposase [Chloroflexi bacterium TSY]
MAQQTKLKLTDRDSRNEAVERLNRYLPLEISGYECTPEKGFDVLVKAAVTRQTIESVCKDLPEMVDGETIRSYLKEQVRVDDLQNLERQVNQALVAGLPGRLMKTKLEIAIDFHDEPFYGKSPELLELTCRGEAEKGTTRFFRVATAYVIFKDVRVTLSILFVRPEDKTADIVTSLLRRLRILGLKVRRLYLDKGFCSSPVLESIKQSGWPAIIACSIRGKTGGTEDFVKGTRAILPSIPLKVRNTVPSRLLLPLCEPILLTNAANKQSDAQRLVYVVLNCSFNPRTVRKLYRKRFGIETSYRCMRKVRAWTTSRNGALRFLLISLGFILVNFWIELRHRFCQLKCQGRRQIDTTRFELPRFSSFLNRAIENIYGVVSIIFSLVDPLGI